MKKYLLIVALGFATLTYAAPCSGDFYACTPEYVASLVEDFTNNCPSGSVITIRTCDDQQTPLYQLTKLDANTGDN